MKFLAFCLLVLLGHSFAATFDGSKYEKSQQMAEGYKIYWTKDGNTMNLALEVSQTGWIGFGLAEETSGSMPGADIVTATVINGVTKIYDRYAVAKATPSEDDCSDWILVSGQETDGKTIVELKRAIDTGDKQDRPFLSTNRVIFAFGRSDTFEEHVFKQASAVTWWGEAPRTEMPKLPSWDFVTVNYTIPNVKTTYYNAFFSVPTIASKVHVVAMEAIFGNNTGQFVHHFLVSGSELENYHGQSSSDENWSMLWAWAPGIGKFFLPNQAGFPFGPGGYKSVKVQIHYDNPTLAAGVVDSDSGLRMYFDSALRPNDAGVMEFGDPIVRNSVPIPKGTGLYHIEYNCPAACTARMPGPLNIFADFLHMHMTGAQQWGTHWRNGTMIRETNRIDYYDFAFQQLTPVNFTLMPGDHFSTHCVYQRQFNNDVKFGQASEEEMCIEYVFYWPKHNVQFCGFTNTRGAPIEANVTFCGYSNITLMNPSIRDPPGGDAKVFGTPSKCAVSSFDSKGVTGSLTVAETDENTTDDPSESGAIALFALFVAFLFFLL